MTNALLPPKTGGWTARDEIKFLRELGTHSMNPPERKELLRGYARGIERRIRWGSIEAQAVREELRRLGVSP